MKKSNLIRMSLLAGCLGACGPAQLPADTEDVANIEPRELAEERVERAPAETPPPLRPLNAWEGVDELEAATGQRYVVVKTSTGVQRMPYVEREGQVVVGGDVVLGSVERIRQARERGHVLDEVWFPTGRIPWFNDDLSATGVTNVRNAANFLNAHTPIRMVEVTGGSERAIRMKEVDGPLSWGGAGGITYNYWSPNASTPDIQYGSTTPSRGTVLHEMGHAMGFPHEFQRTDRDTYVDHVDGCGDPWNYARMDSIYWSGSTSANLSPFDFETIMKSGYESCVVLKSGYSWESPDYRGIGTPLSRHDINSIYRVYAGKLTANETNDGFGLALATGDFDDDNYDDIAVGFRDAITSGTDAGKYRMYVYFFRGVVTDDSEGAIRRRYMPWFHRDVGVTDENDETLALAPGDFNADGITDLAVGMPWYNGGKGQVQLWFVTTTQSDTSKDSVENDYAPWGKKGVQHVRTLTPADVGLNGLGFHRFGAALVAGEFTGSRTSSTKPDDLVIGAPRATNSMVAPYNKSGGAVAHVRGTYTLSPAGWTATLASLLWSPNNVTGTEFGAALAAMPYFCASSTSVDSYNDTFVVGAPGYNSDGGAVYVYGCATNSSGAVLTPSVLRTQTLSQAGARYGHALATFHTVTGSGAIRYDDHYLVIGAPGYAGSDGLDSGIVYLDHLEPSGTKTFIDSYRPGTRYGGDEFGASIAVNQKASAYNSAYGGPDVYIAVGLPGTKVNGVNAGKVYVWRPWNADGTLTNSASVIEALTPTSLTATRFGQALAPLRRLNSQGGFVAGAPLSRELDDALSNTWINAGSIDVLLNESTVSGGYDWNTWRLHLNQEATGDKRPDNL